MPDPTRETISASEVSSLFNASPYRSRWMLWHDFRRDLPGHIEVKEDARMSWGKKLEPLILAQAAQDLALVVEPNSDAAGNQDYVRNGIFGCHRDGQIFCPTRGPGAIETKAVFDSFVWMDKWNRGKNPPRQYELQLQTQMKVGAGGKPFNWGVIAAWLGGEQHYFERDPLTDLWEELDVEGAKFLRSVQANEEPEPLGLEIEAPSLQWYFPLKKGETLDLREEPDADTIVEKMRMLDWHSSERLGHEKCEKELKAFAMMRARGAETILLPHGVKVTISEISRKGYSVGASSYKTVKVFVPDTHKVYASEVSQTGGDLGGFKIADNEG